MLACMIKNLRISHVNRVQMTVGSSIVGFHIGCKRRARDARSRKLEIARSGCRLGGAQRLGSRECLRTRPQPEVVFAAFEIQ